MRLTSFRTINLIGFLIALGLLAFAGYLQIHNHLDPCPLCIVQRTIMGLLAFLFLIGCFMTPRPVSRKIYMGFVLLVAVLGVVVSARHVWLQHLPAGSIPSCGPNLYFIIKNVPILDAAKMIFQGTGHCQEVTWTYMNMSIPEWTLIFFILFSVIAFAQIVRRKN